MGIESLGTLPGPHTDKPGALCGWVRGCVAGELEVPLNGQRSLGGSGGVSGPFGAKSRKPHVVQSEGREVPGLYWGPWVFVQVTTGKRRSHISLDPQITPGGPLPGRWDNTLVLESSVLSALGTLVF